MTGDLYRLSPPTIKSLINREKKEKRCLASYRNEVATSCFLSFAFLLLLVHSRAFKFFTKRTSATEARIYVAPLSESDDSLQSFFFLSFPLLVCLFLLCISFWFGLGRVFLWWLVGVAPVLSDGVIGRRGYKGDKFFHEDFFWDVEGPKLAHTKRSFASEKKKRETRANKNNSGRACWMWPDLLPAASKEEGGGGGGGKELAGCVLIFNAKVTWSA